MQAIPQLSTSLAKQGEQHDILPPHLPAEIVLEVLRHALVSSDHLAFCPLPLTQAEKEAEAKRHPGPWPNYRRRRFSANLRLARWNKCQFDEPVAKGLFETYGSLSLVSKWTRQMARSILFGENRWVLHVTRAMNAIDWIVKRWGTGVMDMMRDVRIEVQCMQEECFDALEVFVEAANAGGVLNNLHVQWLEASRSIQVAMRPAHSTLGSWHFHPMCRDHGLERNAEGGRGLIPSAYKGEDEDFDVDEADMTKYTGPESEPQEWKKDEQVLLPLKKLRNIANVTIEGTVTEKWAKELEEVMMSGSAFINA
ncbi:uncharacterized protein PAC_17565 [Phialocephala subalpina]|uniref:Uncharacterized protein n=1 Tax=Phialocephala subalpina TaxID=576137 RepID=A0A1L7XRI6_9HELO|nr:uncharacterized protein PAC_17565 [Phialocephala subalpina]